MSIPKFFVEKWEAELKAFGKVLRALPADQLAYRPHERSTAAGDLAWQLAEEQHQIAEILDKGETDFQPSPRPGTLDEIVAAWDKATEELRQRLTTFDDIKYAGPAKLLAGGNPVWTDTVGNMLWGYLFDMVHHRGQLSSYIRPMGGKVPAIYGPSGDDTGGM